MAGMSQVLIIGNDNSRWWLVRLLRTSWIICKDKWTSASFEANGECLRQVCCSNTEHYWAPDNTQADNGRLGSGRLSLDLKHWRSDISDEERKRQGQNGAEESVWGVQGLKNVFTIFTPQNIHCFIYIQILFQVIFFCVFNIK